MDPNKLLEEIRELVKHEQELMLGAHKLAHKVEELDEWLSAGGFLPRDWLLAIGKCRTRVSNRA